MDITILKKIQELLDMRAKYNQLTTDKKAQNLMWTKQAFYDQGENAGKLLAWKIKKKQADRAIMSIKTSEDELTTDLMEINGSFRKYYESLYQSECGQSEEAQNNFLNKLQFQTLTEQERTKLQTQITNKDILEAIGELNSGKAP